jgi:tetracycline resistance efflux pump
LEHPYTIWSLVPPVLAITLAIATRQVFLSLFAGIWTGYLVIAGWNPLLASVNAVEACVAVFKDHGNTCVILFSALVGSVIAGIQRSGGVEGFVNWAQHARIVRGRRSAGLLAVAVGMATFIESSIVCLVTGAVARPIFDKLRISREKLAYVCDTVSAPTCVMIPLNGWGAFVLGQIALSGLVEDPVPLLVRAIPLNFYAITSLLLLLTVLMTGWDVGPMRRAERRAREEGKLLRDGAKPMITDEVLALPPEPGTTPRALNMILPIAVMVAMVPVSLWYTGITNLPPDQPREFWNILRACSGRTSVFYGVTTAVVFAGLLYRVQGILPIKEYVDTVLKGAAALVPLAVLMVFAFAIGHLCRYELKTGDYVARVGQQGLARVAGAGLRVRDFLFHRVFNRHQLRHVCDHAGHRVAGRGCGGRAHGAGRIRRARRRRVRRSLLADLGHHHRLVDGISLGPHRPRAHATALCADGGRNRASALSGRRALA